MIIETLAASNGHSCFLLRESSWRPKDLDGAIAGYRRVIELFDQLSPTSTQAILARQGLCVCLGREQKFTEEERELNRLDHDCLQTLGENNLYYVTSRTIHSVLDFIKGDYAKVLQEVRQPLDFYAAAEPANNRNLVQTRGLYGVALTRTGRAAEGEPFLRAAYTDGRKTERFPFEFTFGNVETALGECLFAQGRHAEAMLLHPRSADQGRFAEALQSARDAVA